MTDSATLNLAARVLARTSPEMPADAALRQFFEASRKLGSQQKSAVSRAVFTYFRWVKWLEGRNSLQKCVEQTNALHQRFLADPKSVKIEALAARAVPEWLRTEMDLPAAYLQQLQREPALWLRARPGTATRLASALGHCETTPHSPDALLFRGHQDLFLTPEFHAGAFEIQDLASQLVSLAANPQPGETWWDACAGEGGKTLHLADLMANKGLIWATDRSVRRLTTLKRRASRAKLFNFRAAPWDGSAHLPTKAKLDGILVDAPCSGVGTWQRNPHARWTTSLQDVRELAAIQQRLLGHVAGSLKPGGRLIYAVCTLTRSETTAVADAFSTAHNGFEPTAVFPQSGKPPMELSSPACAVAETDSFTDIRVTLWPQQLNANGMFIATWKRKK